MNRLTFIVIDDSELDCFILKRIIQHVNDDFNVVTYHTACEALKDIERNQNENFSLIFLDLKMPIMDGFQFIDAFQQLPSAIKEKYRVIILSTTRNPTDINRILNYDLVDSIVEKPITREKMNTILTSLDIEA